VPSVYAGEDPVGGNADGKGGDSADDEGPAGAEFLADPADDGAAERGRALPGDRPQRHHRDIRTLIWLHDAHRNGCLAVVQKVYDLESGLTR